MKFVLFYHSFTSCWNHGNAHFLRGYARELIRRDHAVTVHEPARGWSRTNAIQDGGMTDLTEAESLVPGVEIARYESCLPDLDRALDGADVVIAHEWNPAELLGALAARRSNGGRFLLFFHDTHHRAATAPKEIGGFALDGFDAVLAFGEALRQIYLRRGWGRKVYTWHEAADTALFHPCPKERPDTDFIWIGNWGDEERSEELCRFLIEPVARLGIGGRVYGVRYPEEAKRILKDAGLEFPGWLPNHLVPQAFAKARVTVHVPRRAYAEALPGIPTIRMFEAFACGIPLVCAPWEDCETLFPPGSYLRARNSDEMTAAVALLLKDRDLAADLRAAGPRAIKSRHSCAYRVTELLSIVEELRTPGLLTRASAQATFAEAIS